MFSWKRRTRRTLRDEYEILSKTRVRAPAFAKKGYRRVRNAIVVRKYWTNGADFQSPGGGAVRFEFNTRDIIITERAKNRTRKNIFPENASIGRRASPQLDIPPVCMYVGTSQYEVALPKLLSNSSKIKDTPSLKTYRDASAARGRLFPFTDSNIGGPALSRVVYTSICTCVRVCMLLCYVDNVSQSQTVVRVTCVRVVFCFFIV